MTSNVAKQITTTDNKYPIPNNQYPTPDLEL